MPVNAWFIKKQRGIIVNKSEPMTMDLLKKKHSVCRKNELIPTAKKSFIKCLLMLVNAWKSLFCGMITNTAVALLKLPDVTKCLYHYHKCYFKHNFKESRSSGHADEV